MGRRAYVGFALVFLLAFVIGLVVVRYSVGWPHAEQAADGTWHLVTRSTWREALIPAALAGVVATGGWALVHQFALRRAGRIWPFVHAAVIAAPLLAISLYMLSATGSIGCDGSVPRWMLPPNYDGGGCIPMPDNLEAVPFPQEDMVCLGMCADRDGYDPAND